MLHLTLGMLKHDAYVESGEKEKSEEEWLESKKRIMQVKEEENGNQQYWTVLKKNLLKECDIQGEGKHGNGKGNRNRALFSLLWYVIPCT